MIATTTKRRVAHSLTWRVFRAKYQSATMAALPRLDRRLWQIAADVPGMLPRFEAALRAEGVDSGSLEIYLATVNDALDWAAEVGLLFGEPVAVAG